MVRHRKVIVALQWVVIVAYAVLVALPAFLPLPPAGANMLNNLTLAAQFAFWGLWWPGVILAITSLKLSRSIWVNLRSVRGRKGVVGSPEKSPMMPTTKGSSRRI